MEPSGCLVEWQWPPMLFTFFSCQRQRESRCLKFKVTLRKAQTLQIDKQIIYSATDHFILEIGKLNMEHNMTIVITLMNERVLSICCFVCGII